MASLSVLFGMGEAGGISKTFMNNVPIVDSTTSENYGTLYAETSWSRTGIRSTDTLDFEIKLVATSPVAADLPVSGVIPDELT